MRAWELHQAGWSGKAIAQTLKVSAGAVSGWLQRARAAGVEARRRRPAPGPTPQVTAAPRALLPDLLAKGAEAYGFIGAVWTTKRVAAVVTREFGVRSHPAHIGRLVRREGLSLLKPVQRASRRDEAEIAAWREEPWLAPGAQHARRSAPSAS